MRLGIISLPFLPGIVPPKKGAPLPGVFELEEIGGTAKRDYLPAVIAGLILLYAFTGKRGKR